MLSPLNGQRGFTLLEVMATAAVAGLLALASKPMLQDFHKGGSSELRAQWQQTLNKARIAAIASGQPVTVCASVSGTACDGPDWASGWVVLQTAMSTQDRQVVESYLLEDKSGELRVFDERLRKANRIEFSGRGFNARDTRTISMVCETKKADSVAIVIERSGRIYSSVHWTQLQLQTQSPLQPVNNDSLQQVSDQELYETICRS